MAKDDAQNILADEILKDARKRAERALAQAKAEAEKTLADARTEAQTEAAKIVGDARGRAERRGGMVLRSVEQEVARRKLHAREEIVRQVMGEAASRLRSISGDAYRRSLARLVVDAMRRMPAESVVLKVTAASSDGVDVGALSSEIQGALSAEGRSIALRVELTPDAPRGVVIESADGKLYWDNTFEARLRRFKAGLRRTMAPVLFEGS